jgi:hypothetical protein
MQKGSREDVKERYDFQKPYWCTKHGQTHRFGTKVYDKCAARVGVS